MEPICRVRDHFTRQPIFRDLKLHPTAYFGVTDFARPINPTLIDDMAGCLEEYIPKLETDVLVSIADRSGGSLTYALAERLNVPFTLANWYPLGSPGEIEVEQCAGFSGSGHIYLNGLKRGKNVVIVSDVLRTGATALNLIRAVMAAGCRVVMVCFACEIVESGGRQRLTEADCWDKHTMELLSLVKVHLRGECTKEAADEEIFIPPTARENTLRTPPNLIKELRKLPAERVHTATQRISAGFINVPIHRNPNLSYPYSFFQLTDFSPPLEASTVDDMADLCVHLGNFDRCDVIVSEADRGGAPLAQAVGMRTGKPYVLANWYASGEGLGATTHTQVGFSGEGSIVVNGIQRGDRCIFVDDMLSSGGTAEGVLNSVVQLGGIPVEGVFVSEKLYPSPKGPEGLPIRKGKLRLHETFPHLTVTTIVQFVSAGDRTLQPPGRIGD